MSEKKPTNRQNQDQDTGKKKKGKKMNILKTILLTCIIIGFIGGGAAVGFVLSIVKDAEPIDATNIYDLLDVSSFILDSQGQVIEKIQTNELRIIMDYDDMPEHIKKAFVAIEDERFWTHNGLDIKRIFGAAWTNLKTGSRQGASTMNQQLAKLLFLSPEQTLTRKIKDMYYGVIINRQLTKEQILEAYLNTINLGSGAYGVQAASQVYFSKEVKELTIAEAALLAGIARNPSGYSPMKTLEKQHIKEEHYILDDSHSVYTIIYNEAFTNRWKTVLNQMKRLKYITEEEYQEALAQDIKASLKPNRFSSQEISSYFGDLVKKDVIEALEKMGHTKDVARDMMYSGGLRIYSTMDVSIQRIVEEEYENPANFPGTVKNADGTFKRDAEGNIQPQSAMVILDQATGHIKALVGGRMISGQKIYNRALAPRPPGSAIKPIAVYTAAVDKGLTSATVIDDIPIYYNKSTPTTPWPNNWYKDRYYGLITMRESIQQSSNVGAVLFADMLGVDDRSSFLTMFEYMEKMGISTVVKSSNPVIGADGKKYSDETYSTALGGMTRGVTPLELTAAFGVLANQGIYNKPVTFTHIYDRHGNLLYENKQAANRVVTPQVSFVMTDMLKSVVSAGTATRAKLDSGNSRIPVAGKTGTTTAQKDAWFVGYTPYYTASVWIGNDVRDSLVDGSSMATRLWQKVMARVHEGYSAKEFKAPDNLVYVDICTKSGKLATELCALDPRGSTIRKEVFIKGTEPTESCDVHVQAEIHAPSGKLATENTPPWEIISKVFVKRPIPYFPAEHGGITPRDYIYELPTEYYDPFQEFLNKLPFFNTTNNEDDPEWTEDRVIDSRNNN